MNKYRKFIKRIFVILTSEILFSINICLETSNDFLEVEGCLYEVVSIYCYYYICNGFDIKILPQQSYI